ncbi:MAG: 6-bladed beta-propeller, partial [Ignavibacteriaceae bacterium]|nr:6-bladed beta-propeller [Ignavibacteriaceae bacterium]
FGKPGDGSGDFARPKGIATDSYNNIYVVDALFNNVQIFDQRGRLLYSFGEQGTESEKFWLPAGIFIDKQNRIYVADSFNSRIQIFQLRCEN